VIDGALPQQAGAAIHVLADDGDGFGPEGVGATAGDANFGGLGDLFDAFFGGGFGGGSRGPSGPPRGSDLEVVVDLDLEQAVFGAQAPISVRTAVTCDVCDGSTWPKAGRSPATKVQRLGQATVRQSILGQMVTAGPCPRCGGLGEVIASPCERCRGEGRLIEERTYQVDVPAGVDNGSTLRSTGRGAVGPRRGAAGDLYVHVRVRAHDRFTRDGLDLVCDLPIAFTQAALGAHLTIDTLDGTEDLVLPAGTQTGRVFKLRGRGVPHLGGRSRGDVLVRVSVETPTRLSREEEDLLRQPAEERGEDVAPPRRGSSRRSALRSVIPDGRPAQASPVRTSSWTTRASRLSDPDRHHLSVLRVRPGDPLTVSDGAGRWRAARFADPLEPAGEITFVARATRRSPWSSPGQGRSARVGRAEADRGRSRHDRAARRGAFGRGGPAARIGHQLDRLRRISREAAMQSRQCYLPEVAAPLTFADAAARRRLPRTQGGDAPSLARPTVLVGPEGGWSDRELEFGVPRVGLGPSMLRAETAAVAVGVLLAALRSGLVHGHVG
jgi:molecular chaperone DnaJ